MQVSRCLVILLLSIVPAFVFAQAADDGAKAKQARIDAVLEAAIDEIPNLKLPENRAMFSAEAGKELWAHDQKRAIALFRAAAAELVTAQNFAQSKKTSSAYNDLRSGGSTRYQILRTVAEKDAELALEFLASTRPPAVEKAMASDEKTGDQKIGSNNQQYLAQNERQLEQDFYRMAAEQQPEKAVQLLKESLTKGFTNQTLNQLDNLAQKDPAAASDMASQILTKLNHDDLARDGRPVDINFQLASGIIDRAMHQALPPESGSALKAYILDQSQVSQLVTKLITSFINVEQFRAYVGGSIVSFAEKFAPSYVDQLKRIIAQQPNNPPNATEEAYRKLLSSDMPPEQLVAAAGKFPSNYRQNLYQNASTKLFSQGNTAGARAVIQDNFDDDTKDQMLRDIDNQLFYRFLGQGKFTDAETLIPAMPESEQPNLYAQLANNVFNTDRKENIAQALALLSKARALVGNRPETREEMATLMGIIGVTAMIDVDQAMGDYEALIPQINELTGAAAVLTGFQNAQIVRNGEFVMSQGGPFGQFGANPPMIDQFAVHDLDRTLQLVDRFDRPEVRISLKLRMGSVAATPPTEQNVGLRMIRKLPITASQTIFVIN